MADRAKIRGKRSRASWNNLFFIKRRPHPLGIPTNLDRPEQTAQAAYKQAYEKQLERAGFVSESLMTRQGLPMTAELRADLNVLDEHLLADFWEQDTQALQSQNLYYLYQWVFIVGALATTIIAAFGVYIFESHVRAEILGVKWTEVLQILTAIFSGVTTTVSVLSAAQSPHDRWFKARSKAESLRSLYFLFLARRDPFNDQNPTTRAQQLARRVLDILKSESAADD